MIGTFVLHCPVLECEGKTYFGDMCYAETIRKCRPPLTVVSVAARCRSVAKVPSACPLLSEVGAELALRLPDFGVGGLLGWVRLIRCLAQQRRLNQVVEESDVIYVENSCVESFLGAMAAARTGCFSILELRGEGGLARSYMRSRFGPIGGAYSTVFRWLLAYVLANSDAGLYLNESAMVRFPVRGEHMAAISDVRIPLELRHPPHIFTEPASRYLYVGHLEKVKRVDLLLRALADAQQTLPPNWSLTVAGEGPELGCLKGMTRELGIVEHVSFVGRVPWGQALFELYWQSHLLLISSLVETGPRVLLEGMAAGLPVLSSPVGIAPEVLSASMLVVDWDVGVWSRTLTGIVHATSLLTTEAAHNSKKSEMFELTGLERKRREFYQYALELASARRDLRRRATRG
jgi:glycosyltransferase involved in cell wall biosynthesis